jgi:hypothetical protein
MNEVKFTDFLVSCGNPEAFDRTIQQLGAAVLMNDSKGNYPQQDGYYTMRVIGDAGFIKFAIESQGYGKIIRELNPTT